MYHNAIAAIDLTEEAARPVLERARRLLGPHGRLRVVHVLEPHHVQYAFDPTFTGAMIAELEAQSERSAARRVAELCARFAIDEDDRFVIRGRTAQALHRFADEHRCDLLVVGSHGRHGWRRLLGSTANAVLHDTAIDVQVCRIDPPER